MTQVFDAQIHNTWYLFIIQRHRQPEFFNNYLIKTFVDFRSTNHDGRASAFLTWEQFEVGRYKMHFELEQYFKKNGTQSFYPYAEVYREGNKWRIIQFLFT